MTNLAARITGVRLFLPALSVKRFSLAGAIQEELLARQLDTCTTFSDGPWVAYWSAIAYSHIARLDMELTKNGLDPIMHWVKEDHNDSRPPTGIDDLLRRGAAAMSLTPLGQPLNLDTLKNGAAADDAQSSFAAVDAILKAIVYLFIAAWPGNTPKRDESYRMSARLFDILLDAVAPEIGFVIERHVIPSGDENISIYGLVPSASKPDQRIPAILVSNGLEGTNVETMLSFLRSQRTTDCAWFFMEMPGTYAYKNPMEPGDAEQAYRDVISFLASHGLVDSTKIGMLGISFGAYWSTRMAIKDKRLATVISNGAPLRRSFRATASFGMPQIMMQALGNVVGAKSPASLGGKLHALALSQSDMESIQCPILAINGSNDTLLSTNDTIDLASWAPHSKLQLYPDDHCAMAHIQEWMDLSKQWFEEHL
ncbi:hypothetical protein ASPBRDRAFT_46780 [Aspergillus brasiliensis CBS 101740]|uniref:Uncharacterized protein n=1 Tax=Aspergillus brasiliensis (strain CBS 101740 / IMI 381727 / IBT 21946) TaxID=767769 RepID=A0A1L9UA48_ASPBC|nr:hypothetical protein ASPBRDRAFT_46780 [Aspergillus brasiliensis CBS 101740]